MHQSEWPSSENLQTVSAGEEVEKRGILLHCNVMGTATMENSGMEVPYKTKTRATIGPSSPPECLECLKV